jgi:hypothetical protein
MTKAPGFISKSFFALSEGTVRYKHQGSR